MSGPCRLLGGVILALTAAALHPVSAAAEPDPPAEPPPTPRGASEAGEPIAEYPGQTAAGGPAPHVAGRNSGDARALVEEPEDSDDAALAVPRALLSIPRGVLDLVFAPIRAFGELVEEYKLNERAVDILYNDERTAAFYPIVIKEPEYPLSFGMGGFHKGLFGNGEKLSARLMAASLVEYTFETSFEARQLLGSPAWLEAGVRLDHGASLLFAGLGTPRPLERAPPGRLLGPREAAVETWLREDRVHARLGSGVSFGEGGDLARLGVIGLYNLRAFSPNPDRSDDPSIEKVYDTSRIPGFDGAEHIVEIDADMVVDTRDRAGFTRSGVYFESFAGGVPPRGDLPGWFRFGVDIAGSLDLYLERVITLRASLDAIAGDEDDINFAELPRLGGGRRLRGYPTGRFRDMTAALVSLQYDYPIHAFVTGELFVDVGKVGRDLGELFGSNPEDVRPGVGGAILIHDRNDLGFRLNLGWGMDQGVELSFAIGWLGDMDERRERP